MINEMKLRKELNRAVVRDPQPGDRWNEMYSFWVYVIWRKDNLVAWCGAAAPCTFPDDAILYVGTVDDWIEHMTYGSPASIAGETVMYLTDRDNDVSWAEGWYGMLLST